MRREDFQKTIDGKQTDLFTLKNNNGCEVSITNYGGAIIAIMVPDRNGNIANVIQSHDTLDGLINSPEPFLSTLVGRYANRIAKGQFCLDGKYYQLEINNGPNALHGGSQGFHKKVWDAEQIGDNRLVLKLTSAYGDGGFRGELRISVVYTFDNSNTLTIAYRATTNKKTIINLTSHGFFSLSGVANPTPTIEQQQCLINADYYLPIDETSIPTGEIRFVRGTPFDFRQMKAIGKDIDADDEQIRNGAGYDHCFVLNKREEGELSHAASLEDPQTGRTLAVYTTEPGLQVYTDNWADGFAGWHGATFPRRSAICFEAQHFPDSPNRSYFPSVILRPEEKYEQITKYHFGLKE